MNEDNGLLNNYQYKVVHNERKALKEQRMEYVNLTPHAIVLNDGRRFEPSGNVARVSVGFTDIIDDVCEQIFGAVENLPPPKEDTKYIVSAMVLSAVAGREDVVAPATGHLLTVRNDKGHIVSVPCFTR